MAGASCRPPGKGLRPLQTVGVHASRLEAVLRQDQAGDEGNEIAVMPALLAVPARLGRW